jgi:hypothetical protein
MKEIKNTRIFGCKFYNPFKYPEVILYNTILHIIVIVEGAIELISLSSIRPGWSFDYVCWASLRQIEKEIRQKSYLLGNNK